MKDNKKLYNKVMESVAKQVKKTLNEGAGAGYTVTIDGLNATNIQLGEKSMKGNDEIIKFTADIVPGVVEKWEAESYYDYISSDGLEYDGQILQEYDEEDRQVDGGSIQGYVYMEDIYDDNEEDAIDYIQKHLTDFMIEVPYGGGWVHTDLTNPMEFENCEAKVRDNYYGGETIFFDKIQIESEAIVENINWFFAHTGEFEEIFGLEDPNFDDNDRYTLESVNTKLDKKHINESFTLDDDLRRIIRDFRTNIDMERFYEVGYNEANDEYEPSLRRIMNTYDPYVEEVISMLSSPEPIYNIENDIKSLAQDNEWENGTEADMVISFLEDLYDWCERHGLSKTINESLTEKDKEDAEDKMDKWHEGKRKQNIKACSDDKLKMNIAICKRKGYDAEAAQLQAELDSRGVKENNKKSKKSKKAVNEAEVNDLERFSPEFAELVQGIKDGSHEINTEKDAEIMFDALVPGSDQADTLGGELLRAAERIAYRYWNDGDKAGVRYGRETVNPAVRFMYGNIYDHTMDNPLWRLVKKFKGWVDYGNVESDLTDKEYEEYTMRLLRETVRYIAVKDMWAIKNTQDMWDYKDKELDVDRDDWDEDDW